MIYYPDENNVPSWANTALGALGYNSDPAKIQLLIRKFFEEGTRYALVSNDFIGSSSTVFLQTQHVLFVQPLQQSTIRIPGSEVIPIPLFHALGGRRSEDYVARVEPSASGGKKMAEYMVDVIHSSGIDEARLRTSAFSAPTTSFIDGRAT